LKPWFPFLKLFITALEKLESIRGTFWRGVHGDVGSMFADGEIHIWWSVNSCSVNPKIVEHFFEETGTLFAIDAIRGKNITTFSAFPEEQEILLMPGTRLSAKCQSVKFKDQWFLVSLQEESPSKLVFFEKPL
jgi:hypothetical protein